MTRKKSDRRKETVTKEICEKLEISYNNNFFNPKNSTISLPFVEAVLRKVATLTNRVPSGLNAKEEHIWRLLNKSQEAFILSLELINKVTIPYRIEVFCFLIINAWELLLKAKIIKDEGLSGIFKNGLYDKSISFEKCLLKKIKENSEEYDNLILIDELRDNAVHLFIPLIPPLMMALFQSCVFNYSRILKIWFDEDITKKIPDGMMFLIADIDPAIHSSLSLKKTLSTESLKFLDEWNDKIINRLETSDPEKENLHYFIQPIETKLVSANNIKNASTVLYTSESGHPVTKVVQKSNYDNTHPHFSSELVTILQKKNIPITKRDIEKVLPKLYKIKENEGFCVIPKQGRPQYSNAYKDWIIDSYTADNTFFIKSRKDFTQNGFSG